MTRSSCASEKPAATCRASLGNEGRLGTFLGVQGIKPPNNMAERASCHAMLWRKMSGGTAGEWGGRFVD